MELTPDPGETGVGGFNLARRLREMKGVVERREGGEAEGSASRRVVSTLEVEEQI